MIPHRRRPLPYTASMAIDAALMANSDVKRANNEAVKSLLPLVRGQVLDPAEKMARLAEAIHWMHTSSEKSDESTAALKEARVARPGENGQEHQEER